MKKHYVILTVMILIITATGWCDEKTIYSASTTAIDGIIQYYSSMSKLENLNSVTKDGINYKDMCDYLQKNRETLITYLCETNTYHHLGQAEKSISSLYRNQSAYHAYSKIEHRAAAPGYFDSVTGHRYYKTSAENYSEYSRTGKFLKTVSSDLPLLTRSRNIHAIDEDNYILYQRSLLGEKNYMILPGYEKHPEGWQAEKAMITLK